MESKLLDNAVNAFATLPGLGRKTALRLALHMLKQPKQDVEAFASAIVRMKEEVKYCKCCHTVSDDEVCAICRNPKRDQSIICVVENVQDVDAIENTTQYHGLYHVLGGVIAPIEGIGPKDLEIDSLVERIKQGGVKEIILALPTTMEGDTTNYYIYRRVMNVIENNNVGDEQSAGTEAPIFSLLARGVAIGNELEYTDQLTLGRSIVNRTPFINQ